MKKVLKFKASWCAPCKHLTQILTSVNQEITTNQQNLVKTFRKLDVIDTKTDGYIKSDQNVMAYNLSATTEVQAGSQQTNTYDELVFDYNSAVDLLYSFYTDFNSAGFVGTKVDLDDIKLLKFRRNLKVQDGRNITHHASFSLFMN